MDTYRQPPISNGNPDEQALIRRWWREEERGRGLIVWEYHLAGCYLDAMWFPEHSLAGTERPGLQTASSFPIDGQAVVLCEAKLSLTPELIGQALVYRTFAQRRGATVLRTVIFARQGRQELRQAARDLGLEVVISTAPVAAA